MTTDRDPLAGVEAHSTVFLDKAPTRLLPEPAVRKAFAEWFRGEAADARNHESTSSDARTYDRLADRLVHGGKEKRS